MDELIKVCKEVLAWHKETAECVPEFFTMEDHTLFDLLEEAIDKVEGPKDLHENYDYE